MQRAELVGLPIDSLMNGPLIGTNHRRRMDAVLQHLHKAGCTLAQCADNKRMGRSLETLKPYARRLSLAFPDYVPLHMRPKKEPKAKKPRKVKET
jgi:hypothetical protein